MRKVRFLCACFVVAFVAYLCLPSVNDPSSRRASKHSLTKNQLKQFGIALHDYHDMSGSLPQVTFKNEDEDPVHSWMTMLLPHVEQGPLFDQIDLSKPWDDQSQVKLFQQPVEAYWSPAINKRKVNITKPVPSHFAGNVHVIRDGEPLNFGGITDGQGNTILLGEAFGDFEPWGKPGNIRNPMHGINKMTSGFGTQQIVRDGYFGSRRAPGCLFVLVDGAMRFISEDTDPEVLRRLALPNDGEEVGEF